MHPTRRRSDVRRMCSCATRCAAPYGESRKCLAARRSNDFCRSPESPQVPSKQATILPSSDGCPICGLAEAVDSPRSSDPFPGFWGGAVMRVATGRRRARTGVAWRWLTRRAAILVVLVLGLTAAAPAQRLVKPGVDPLPLAWLWDWFALPAGWASPPTPPTPAQQSAGSAAGKSHPAAAAATRAGGGARRAPGKGTGQLDPFSPHETARQAVTTGVASGDQSFDPVRSKRIDRKSTR